jgi:TolB protein
MKRFLPILLALVLLAACAGPAQTGTPDAATSETATPAISATATPTSGPAVAVRPIILSVREGLFTHLFAYTPESGLIRLTAGAWDDITPAVSADGTRVAFASSRNDYFDIYVLDLVTGETTRLTDSYTYDASPSFSPDGMWVAFESYLDDNLEIMIMPVDGSQDPIRLTDSPGVADHSPAWSPTGRTLAFVSTRGGDSDVWLADLDRAGEDRYTNLSNTPQAAESRPVWSPDGQQLAWASTVYGPSSRSSGIYLWDSESAERPALRVIEGTSPAWNPDGESLAIAVSTLDRNYLTAYGLDGTLLIPPIALPGEVRGMAWSVASIPDPEPDPFRQAVSVTPTPLWTLAISPLSEGPVERWGLVDVPDVEAPYPRLHDLVDDSFAALRQEIVNEAGWDVLANLQNAYIPLSTAPDPGLGESWLLTGRAFAVNPITLNAGWMMAIREDQGVETTWRLFLRTQAQDGSRGEPLHDLPWDLYSRYNIDPTAFDQGGRLMKEVPSGYFIDFTSLAGQYGWRRVPALADWRTYFNGTNVTQYVLASDLDWYKAMLEIYPPEVLITPSPIPTATLTPTITNTPIPWATDTPTPSSTSTIHPTFTPLPLQSPTASSTPPPPVTATSTVTVTPGQTDTPTPTATSTP